MATPVKENNLPKSSADSKLSADDAALEMVRLLEEHFDEMGWSEEERNRRVALAGTRVDAAVARAKAEGPA